MKSGNCPSKSEKTSRNQDKCLASLGFEILQPDKEPLHRTSLVRLSRQHHLLHRVAEFLPQFSFRKAEAAVQATGAAAFHLRCEGSHRNVPVPVRRFRASFSSAEPMPASVFRSDCQAADHIMLPGKQQDTHHGFSLFYTQGPLVSIKRRTVFLWSPTLLPVSRPGKFPRTRRLRDISCPCPQALRLTVISWVTMCSMPGCRCLSFTRKEGLGLLTAHCSRGPVHLLRNTAGGVLWLCSSGFPEIS